MTHAGEAVAIRRSCPPESLHALADIAVSRDVVYATRGDTRLRLDIAAPKSGDAPLVLLLHGGGWSGGSRASMHGEMDALARRGYAAAAIQYRLADAPHNLFPAALEDVQCALRYLGAHASSFGADPARVAAAGFSAGAHLASLLGTAPDTAAVNAGCGSGAARVRAVISYAGPQDLRVRGPYTAEQARLVTNFLGVFSGDAPEVARTASPIAHVRRGAPPFLLVQGTDDDLVPLHHAHWMRQALRDVGTPATVLELRGQGHGYAGLAASTDDRVRCTTLEFLQRWLR